MAFQVLADCTTSAQRGEVVVVCGPSGSGKSTLIKCINGLEPYQKGRITVDGVDVGDPKTRLSKVRAGIGMVFQHFELYPHMNAIDNIAPTIHSSRDRAMPRGNQDFSTDANSCVSAMRGRWKTARRRRPG